MLELIERYAISSLEAHILEYLLRKSSGSGWVHGITCGQIAKKLRVSGSTVRRYLKKLEERGLIAKKALRTADGKTFLALQVKIERLNKNKESVDINKQQQQTNNGVQIDRGEESKPLSDEEKEIVRLIVQNDLRLKRVPLHKAVFFLLNSEDREKMMGEIEWADSELSIKNPVGFLVVKSRVSRERSKRWEWLVSDDEAVPQELLELYEEFLEEKRKEEEMEIKQQAVEDILARCELYGIEPPASRDELLKMTPEELLEVEKEVVIRAGRKILEENKELKLRFRKEYEKIRSSSIPEKDKPYIFYSLVLEMSRRFAVSS